MGGSLDIIDRTIPFIVKVIIRINIETLKSGLHGPSVLLFVSLNKSA